MKKNSEKNFNKKLRRPILLAFRAVCEKDNYFI